MLSFWQGGVRARLRQLDGVALGALDSKEYCLQVDASASS
jgi:hypothetical protein